MLNIKWKLRSRKILDKTCLACCWLWVPDWIINIRTSSFFSATWGPIPAQVKHFPGMVDCKIGQILYSPLYPHPLQCGPAVLFIKRRTPAWPYNWLWPIKYGSEIVPVLSLGFKRFCSLLLAVLGSLPPPCGQMAGLLEAERPHDQSQVCPIAPEIWQNLEISKAANPTCNWPLTCEGAQSGQPKLPPCRVMC